MRFVSSMRRKRISVQRLCKVLDVVRADTCWKERGLRRQRDDMVLLVMSLGLTLSNETYGSAHGAELRDNGLTIGAGASPG